MGGVYIEMGVVFLGGLGYLTLVLTLALVLLVLVLVLVLVLEY